MVRLTHPATRVDRFVRHNGESVGPEVQPQQPSTLVPVPDRCRWDEWVFIRYQALSDHYYYSGYVTSKARFCPLYLRADGHAVIGYEEDDGDVVLAPDPERVRDEDGIRLVVLPYLAVPYDPQVLWNRLMDQAIVCPPEQLDAKRLVQHRIGLETDGSDLPLAYPLGYILGRSRMGVSDLVVVDLRRHGGGWKDAETLDAVVRDMLWDVSDWDGSLRGGAGHVLVRLPAYLLDPSHPYGGYEESAIRQIVRRYLPAGITFDVEFYEVQEAP